MAQAVFIARLRAVVTSAPAKQSFQAVTLFIYFFHCHWYCYKDVFLQTGLRSAKVKFIITINQISILFLTILFLYQTINQISRQTTRGLSDLKEASLLTSQSSSSSSPFIIIIIVINIVIAPFSFNRHRICHQNFAKTAME